MTNEAKIKLVDTLLTELSNQVSSDEALLFVGTLNKEIGLKGFLMAQSGHPVFQYKDRFIIYLESSTPEKVSKAAEPVKFIDFKVAVPYYMEDLFNYIDFIGKGK